ncbi:hypothetical protein EU803_11165 [Loktanella sp. IMCC34160]|uniref:hypothetical protein n=1 Tax=Loktanella sp. IMCC34160 TaxID=2510646 RepID=UPI00101C39EC|nr:hypothetical protein [Loktanella sp. IMCC34160]RYG90562.1 hypothetical protein EU803_11165 [Loktanella sp. IMCC34160]
MRRVFLHTGFHKTGTTSAQAFLFANRKKIWPHHAMILPFRTRANRTRMAATYHSSSRDPISLDEFRFRLRGMFAEIDFKSDRGLIISDENFSGLRPSLNSDPGYPAAADLAEALVDEVHALFPGEEVNITLYLSTRAPSAWLRSLWAHEVRKGWTPLGLDEFSEQFAALSDLSQTVHAIADRLPGCTVVEHRLEVLSLLPFGPATPFVDFLDLPEAELASFDRPAPENHSPPTEVLQQLLELNRMDLPLEELKERKQAVLRAHWKKAKS